jgi:hypothetical protein
LGEVEGGAGAFFPCSLEIELEEGEPAEFAQDVGGVKGGNALAAVEWTGPIGSEEGTAPIADFDFISYGCSKGGVSEENADVGVELLYVLVKFFEAFLDLGAGPVEGGDVVVRGADLANVADQAGQAVYAHVTHDVAEELAGCAHERAAIVFLIFPWRLADYGDAVVHAIQYDWMLVGYDSRHGR